MTISQADLHNLLSKNSVAQAVKDAMAGDLLAAECSTLVQRWQGNRAAVRAARHRKTQHKLVRMDNYLASLRQLERARSRHGASTKIYDYDFAGFSVRDIYSMLYVAYIEARKKKRTTYDEHRFEVNAAENLLLLARDIHDHKYQPSRSEAFIVYEPVIREIFAAPFRDRIVHHLIVNICFPYWNRRFINDSYSCRYGKGNNYAINRLRHHMAAVSKNHAQDAFVVSFDIKGFFMSLNRKRLFDVAEWGLHQQFPQGGQLCNLCAYLWKQVILDDPLQFVRIRGRLCDWNLLPRDKSLFFQPPNCGIVIGNLTSQLLSNMYLDSLDRFVTEQLGYHHYGRYVDDFFIVIPASEASDVDVIIAKIRHHLQSLGLTLHPHKVKWNPVSRGVTFLGRRVFINHVEPIGKYTAKYYKALELYLHARIKRDSLMSYLGGCADFGCRRIQCAIWQSFGLCLDFAPQYPQTQFSLNQIPIQLKFDL